MSCRENEALYTTTEGGEDGALHQQLVRHSFDYRELPGEHQQLQQQQQQPTEFHHPIHTPDSTP